MPVYEETDPKKITKDGRKYYYRCYYKDKYGNIKQIKSKKYKGKRECEKAEREFLNTIQYKDIPDYDITFENTLYEWLEYKKNIVKITSYYCIEKKVKKHILSFFKEYKLHSIKINDILNWKNELAKKSLSLGSQNTIISYLISILEYSSNNYNFDSKIISKIQKHRIDIPIKKKDSEINFWTYKEFKQFITNVDNNFYYLLFNFLYFTGVRLGECLALNWNDIDFDKKTLSITKSQSPEIDNAKYIIVSPKTKNSIRTIDLDDNTLELLKQHYEKESKLFNFKKDMFIFGNIAPVGRTSIRRNLYHYINISNIKKITPHGFRHSHASLLIDLGLSFEEVAERLGDTIEMIQNTYFHMFPERKSNTVKVLNSLKS